MRTVFDKHKKNHLKGWSFCLRITRGSRLYYLLLLAADNLYYNHLYMTYEEIISIFPQDANPVGEMERELIRARGAGFVETILRDAENEQRFEAAYIGAF